MGIFRNSLLPIAIGSRTGRLNIVRVSEFEIDEFALVESSENFMETTTSREHNMFNIIMDLNRARNSWTGLDQVTFQIIGHH